MSKKKKQNKSQFGRDFVARAEYLAGAPTPTPSKKGMLKKLERKHKGRHGRADDGSYHLGASAPFLFLYP